MSSPKHSHRETLNFYRPATELDDEVPAAELPRKPLPVSAPTLKNNTGATVGSETANWVDASMGGSDLVVNPSGVTRRRTRPSLSFGEVTQQPFDEQAEAELPRVPESLDTSLAVSPAESATMARAEFPADESLPEAPPEVAFGYGDCAAFLEEAARIEGVFAVALVNYESGITLDARCKRQNFDLQTAALGMARVLSAKLSLLESLKSSDKLQDILVTLDAQVYILWPLQSSTNLFLFLASDRAVANIGLARHSLQKLTSNWQSAGTSR